MSVARDEDKSVHFWQFYSPSQSLCVDPGNVPAMPAKYLFASLWQEDDADDESDNMIRKIIDKKFSQLHHESTFLTDPFGHMHSHIY